MLLLLLVVVVVEGNCSLAMHCEIGKTKVAILTVN